MATLACHTWRCLIRPSSPKAAGARDDSSTPIRGAAERPAATFNPKRLIDASVHTRQKNTTPSVTTKPPQQSGWLTWGRIENAAKANNPGRQENTGEDGSFPTSDHEAALAEARWEDSNAQPLLAAGSAVARGSSRTCPARAWNRFPRLRRWYRSTARPSTAPARCPGRPHDH